MLSPIRKVLDVIEKDRYVRRMRLIFSVTHPNRNTHKLLEISALYILDYFKENDSSGFNSSTTLAFLDFTCYGRKANFILCFRHT